MKNTQSSRVAPILALALGAFFAAHCGTNTPYRGQSGSEVVSNGNGGGAGVSNEPPGGDVVVCPCGVASAAYSAVLRVTLVTRDRGPFVSSTYPWCRANAATPGGALEIPPECGRLRLRVEEVLHADVALAAGDEIEAGTDGNLLCFLGLEDVAIGEHALAFARWPVPELPACEARQACRSACEQRFEHEVSACEADAGGDPSQCDPASPQEHCAGSCDDGYDDVCPPRPALSPQAIREEASVRLAAWGDLIVFAKTAEGEFKVPASELPLLWGDLRQCLNRVGNWHTTPGAFPGGNIP